MSSAPELYPPIGFVRTCFTQKFGVPRQALMVSEARGVLKLNPVPSFRVALNHLESFSHVWLIYVFHQHLEKSWRPTIRPPRVDAPRRVGVFASRSPHRPNPIGMSAVRLERVDLNAPGGIEIHLGGVDLMDGTPVLDIKPYLTYSDSLPEANDGWAKGQIPKYAVSFSPRSLEKLARESSARHPQLQRLIAEMLEWDPRPTSQRRAMRIEAPESEGLKFGFRILDLDVQWEIRDRAIYVVDLVEERDIR